MLVSTIQKGLLIAATLLLPVVTQAALPIWQIVPAESSLKFTATQNGSPLSGEFKKFDGDISYAPDQLAGSFIKINVDISSVSDALNQIADTLKSAEWFNTKVFPQAVFQSTEFSKTGDKTFQVKGKLTIRDKTLPVTLNVKEVEYSASKAHMEGTTTIKRTAFGVGQGEWAGTTAIKDDVKIDFVVVATKK
jgi:polyisoprenoid-binding protein YceI